MQALYWDGRKLEFERNYRPANEAANTPRAGAESHIPTALVRVHLAGICSTDLQILKGYMGFTGVPGHEFVGTVTDGPPNLRGKRVVGEINFGCGRCDHCRHNLSRHCAARRVMGIVDADGAFAELVAVPAANLHEIPDTLADEEAVFTEPLAAAFEILEQVRIGREQEILVLGDGKLGNLCAQVLIATGAAVTTVGKHQDKLELIRRSGSRTVLLNDWSPRTYDVVVEATGSEAALKLAISAVRPRGTLILKSTVAVDHRLSLAPLVINEMTVIGSRCGVFAPALNALERNQIAVRPLIEKIYGLSDGIEAMAHAGRTGTLKILMRPGQ
jgi:threonine dehydrogenase-like Zn-dependent dehydrogenase